MVKCIWCGEEIEGSIKDHIAEKHVILKKQEKTQPLPIAPTPATAPKTTTVNTTEKPEITKKDTPTLPLEKPKRRYLNADEIITLLHNVNQTFPKIEIPPCPISKQEE